MDAILIVRGPVSPLHTVAGLALLRRNLLTARSAGAGRLFVLHAAGDPHVAAIAAALPTLWPAQPEPVVLGEAATIAAALDQAQPVALVMDIAHVHDRRLQPLLDQARQAPAHLHAPQLADATYGAPLVLAPARLALSTLQVMLEDGGLSAWISAHGDEVHGVATPTDWMDVPLSGDAADERRAVDALWESCRKPVDGLVSKNLNRHISLFISRRIVNTSITPNHISSLCIGLGVLSGVCVAQGSYGAIVAGALLLKANSIIDGVDGELARVKWAYSKIGELLDSMGDNIANFSFFGALTWAMWSRGEVMWAKVGAAMLGMWVIHLIFTYGQLRGTGRGDVLIVRQRVDELATGLFARIIDVLRYKILRRDSFVMLALVMCVLDQPGPLLGIMAVGAVIPIIGILIHLVGALLPRKAQPADADVIG
jgi:1L-myo-inositol 1-phosphate cytidylyltransferase / CDP-L-myo-inositol myo-inositolphosphotransferase